MAVIAFKTRIYPNDEISHRLKIYAAARRKAYNFALEEINAYLDDLQEGEKIQLTKWIGDTDKLFNQMKKTKGSTEGLSGIGLGKFVWIAENRVPNSVAQGAIKTDLKAAFTRFFKKQGKHPRPARFRDGQHFSLSNVQLKTTDIDHNHVRIMHCGVVRMAESISYTVTKLCRTSFSKHGEHWYVSFNIEVPDEEYYQRVASVRSSVVGIDINSGVMVADSTGRMRFAPAKLAQLAKRKDGINANISRIVHKNLMITVAKCDKCCDKVKGVESKKHLCNDCAEVFYPLSRSRKIRKMRESLARIARKEANIRKNMIEQETLYYCQTYDEIKLERLEVQRMTQSAPNKRKEGKEPGTTNAISAKRNRAFVGVSPYMFRHRMEMKAEKLGSVVRLVNPAYTSKMCHECGHVSPDNRNGQRFVCVACGHTNHADLNAALNIRDKRPLDKTHTR
ncbi:RNA-guided endonuclease TnpB family protein [Photobacterium japonica]|uniref:RNA-guided endonuclease InsQ/TnpB family protein n=1 Tax=Photobacterium japonica TaxID=2910235 RepID=UPI003D12872B